MIDDHDRVSWRQKLLLRVIRELPFPPCQSIIIWGRGKRKSRKGRKDFPTPPLTFGEPNTTGGAVI